MKIGMKKWQLNGTYIWNNLAKYNLFLYDLFSKQHNNPLQRSPWSFFKRFYTWMSLDSCFLNKAADMIKELKTIDTVSLFWNIWYKEISLYICNSAIVHVRHIFLPCVLKTHLDNFMNVKMTYQCTYSKMYLSN